MSRPLLLGLFASTLSLPASAHIRLDFPASRHPIPAVEDNSNLKSAPCGGAGDSRTTDPERISTFRAGETITVRWHETIHHPSHYRIAFDPEGQDDFVDPSGPTDIVEPPVLPVLLDGIADETSDPDEFAVAVTLPSEPCDRCTLQVIQYMYDNARSPLYYQCADIVLLPASSGEPNGSGGSGDGSGSGRGGAATGSGGASPASGGSTAASGGEASDGEPTDEENAGCQISRTGATGRGFLFALGALGIALGRRRRPRAIA